MRISVIVLTWNGRAYVAGCLEALLAQDYPAFEVLVVDNGSIDGTPDLVAERFPSVQLIRNLRNLGFAAGNNIGLRAATGEILVLVNQDTEAHPGFLKALARAFADPTVGLAGCKLLYPDGTIQHAGGFLYGPRGETEHIGRGAPDDGRCEEPAEPEFVTAAAVGISRACLARIGPLDEGFAPAYYEDVDWCYRARAAGFLVAYMPEAVLTHYESVTADRSSQRHKMNLNHGRIRFVLKHWPLDRLLEEFGPAEARWVAAMPRSTELMAARGAYLQVLMDLPGILAFRESSDAEAMALASLLADLRAGALTSLEAMTAEPALAPMPPPSAPPPSSPTLDEVQGQAPLSSSTLPAPPTPIVDESQPWAVIPPSTPLPSPGPTAADVAEQQPSFGSASHQPLSAPRSLRARLRRFWAGLRHLDVLPNLVRQVQQQDQALAQHDHGLAQHHQALTQHHQALTQQHQALSQYHQALDQQHRALAQLARSLAEHHEALTQYHQALDQHYQALVQHAQVQTHLGELTSWVGGRVDDLVARSTEQGNALADLAHDVAENIRELTAVAEGLARLETSEPEDAGNG